MNKQLELVREFHEKFKQPILPAPALIPEDRSNLRYRLMNDEVQEYKAGTEAKDLENIAKELTDILYAVYGTVLEHGLQDKLDAMFAEVHASNMSKDYNEYKMVKGANYFKANMEKFFT